MSEEKFWGYHAILDAAGCDLDKMTSYENVYNFAKQLVKDIDMIAYGEPQIVNFGSGNKAGYTLVQLIETSNICAHFANENQEIYLDVFSCKPFETNDVLSVIDESFKPTSKKVNFIVRQAPVQQLR
jgi:S-adenosylmethionine/arginine decarboxylase-like enzyme